MELPERLRSWAKNRKRLNLDDRLLLKAAYEIEKAKRERDERLTRESGLALVDEANRWEAAYRRERDRLAKIAEALRQAINVSDHLMQMIPHQTWRDEGGDDGQGHYEGDYRAARIMDDIRGWRETLAESERSEQ